MSKQHHAGMADIGKMGEIVVVSHCTAAGIARPALLRAQLHKLRCLPAPQRIALCLSAGAVALRAQLHMLRCLPAQQRIALCLQQRTKLRRHRRRSAGCGNLRAVWLRLVRTPDQPVASLDAAASGWYAHMQKHIIIRT
jgi:hypothetical protein